MDEIESRPEPEESLIKPDHFGSSTDHIWFQEDFVDPEDLQTMQDFFPSINKWNNRMDTEENDDGTCIYDENYWLDRVCTSDIISELSPVVYGIVEKYIDKLACALEEKFFVDLKRRSPVIVRWLPGLEQQPHADKQLNDGTPNPFTTYDLNSIIYWNEDFEGGELYYPEHDIERTIKAGMAVAHIGDINYLHGVRCIESGVRWTSPNFYTITGFREGHPWPY